MTPPGATIAESMERNSIDQTEMAERLGISRKHLVDILNGSAPITTDTALRLQRVLNVPARFWNSLERLYREFLASRADERAMMEQAQWADNFKAFYSRMADWGWVSPARKSSEKLKALLSFFAVASPDAWKVRWERLQAQFRKSPKLKSDKYALSAWLRRGEIMASLIRTGPFNNERFRAALHEIRAMTSCPPDSLQEGLNHLCAPCGVAVVFVPELPNTASGATRWINPDKAILQLSLRYKTNDHLWFTFFHEAGHILLHQKKAIFVESDHYQNACEAEADTFACDMLIPHSQWAAFIARNVFIKSTIIPFADSHRIAPAIVVARLQHEKRIPFQTALNSLTK
ncbi:MAG: HigA family addiction module antitoxin [Candidatus Sumerlaeota bacterium]|nr:HigA family addiction module antitoxin [Candidatus Sumerlaeota bacterium]